MLETGAVSAAYGKMRILSGVDLFLEEGESVALVGTNGSGKTTFLRVISGFLRPTAGSVRFLGEDISRLTPEKRVGRGIAHVPESREIFSKQTVLANLRLGAYLRIRRRGDLAVRRDLDRVLEIFPVLSRRLRQTAGTLSGGEQQMLAIGRALMSRPRLLLLDEPSTGLAPLVVKEIFRVLRNLIREMNLSLLLVEQNTRLALKTVNRGYLLERGRIARADHSQGLLEYLNAAGLAQGAGAGKIAEGRGSVKDAGIGS
ncbi:MAG: ABC transporter ATP-binding protein [Deltaproteobacteria bacterium]|nr:ABC transporter ATP-binding protein [Deltaproteobacteria bacterium]